MRDTAQPAGEIGVAEQAARPQQHHEQQDDAEEQVREALDVEPLRIAELAERLIADRDDDGADDGPGDGAHATDDEHREHQHGGVERVLAGVRAADRLDAQRARQPDHGDADRPGGQPGAEHADAERRRGDLVLPRRDREATGAGLAEPVGDEHRKRRGEPQPDGALQGRHAGQPAGTLRELLPVLHHLVDHEQHGERDHRRRQTPGPRDGDADDRAERERHEHRDDRRRQGAEVDVAQPEREVGELLRLGRDRDRADRHGVRRDLGEREVSEREDAGVAHEHLEAEHQHQVDEQLLDEQLPGASRRSRCRRSPATNRAIDRIAVAAADRPTRNHHGSLIRAPQSSP